jgi:hypothetical protein
MPIIPFLPPWVVSSPCTGAEFGRQVFEATVLKYTTDKFGQFQYKIQVTNSLFPSLPRISLISSTDHRSLFVLKNLRVVQAFELIL